MDFWIRASQLILSLSILIVVHEFGHYLTAIWFKTKVEKFYLFFNPYFSIFKKQIGDTEWGLGWIPLGGYVKIAGMIDESMDKEQLAQPMQPWEFRAKPAWQRLIIMLGGIIVNIIVGFVLYVIILFTWGEERVDYNKLHNGIAVHPYFEQFGFRSGDQLISVNGKDPEIIHKLGMEIMIFGKNTFKVKHTDGKIETIVLPEDMGQKMWENNAENAFGMRMFFDGIERLDSTSQAAKLGLEHGDKITAVNGKKILFFDEFKSALFHNKGKKLEITIEKKDTSFNKEFILNKEGILGFEPKVSITTDSAAIYTKYYPFGESIALGIAKGTKGLYANIAQFKYVFSKKGAESIGGMGSIGKLFPSTWNWQAFWTLTAFLSMMLAIMNLLPIPALDGGHVVFLLYEMISGRPPSQRFLEIAQYAGFIIIMALILYANGKDLINAIF